MIQKGNKILIIWLLCKIYSRLLSVFVCLLQPVEDDNVYAKIRLDFIAKKKQFSQLLWLLAWVRIQH